MILHKNEGLVLSGLLMMLAMMTGVFAWSSLGYLLHLPMTPLHFPIASLLTWALLLWASQGTQFELSFAQGIMVLALYCALVVGFSQLAYLIWDYSADGRWYHSEGIMRLILGWNPVTTPLSHPNDTIYVQHYPKSEWILCASLTMLFSSLEKAKLIHFFFHVLVLALGTIVFKQFFDFRSYAIPLLASIVLGLNPIFLAQAFTFYNDADLATCLIGVLFIFFLHSQAQGKDRTFLLLAAFPLLAYTAHIKYTGLAYLAFMLFFYLVLYTWQRRRQALSLLAYLTVSLVLIVGLLGFHPYVTNTLDTGHPFYPLMGPDPIDIMEPNTPEDLRDLNPLAKFLMATLADPDGNRDWIVEIHPDRLFDLEDPSSYAMADTRLRGFGLYSPLLFLLLVPSLGFGLGFWKPQQGHGEKAYVVYMVLVLLAIALLSGQMWWARYIAYLWVLLPLALCGLFRQKKILPALLALALLAMCVANVGHFASAYFSLRLPAQDQVQEAIRYDLQAPPEQEGGYLAADRYERVVLHNFWYMDKIKDMKISPIEPACFYPLTRTPAGEDLPLDFVEDMVESGRS